MRDRKIQRRSHAERLRKAVFEITNIARSLINSDSNPDEVFHQAALLYINGEKTFSPDELGEVYQSLLELHPQIDRQVGELTMTLPARRRKSVGAYYTPPSLAEHLLDAALEPVIQRRLQSLEPEEAVLGMRVLDPACGAGSLLAAAARRMADRLSAVTSHSYESACQSVVKNCLYGVDKDEIAVELTRLNLRRLANFSGNENLQNLRIGNALLYASGACHHEIADEVCAQALSNHRGTADFFEPPLAIAEVAKKHRFFHWDLEFHSVLDTGGFDVIIGNPPWDKVEIEEREWFASRYPDIAKIKTAAKRREAIDRLSATNPTLYNEFLTHRREIDEISTLLRNGGNFPETSVGRNINLYSLFVELSVSLLQTNGYAALLTPIGIATEDTCKALISRLLRERKLRSLIGFVNSPHIFFAINNRMRFCSITVTGAAIHDSATVAFDCESVGVVSQKQAKMSAADVNLMNPISQTLPIVSDPAKFEILNYVYENNPAWCHHEQTHDSWPGEPRQQINISDYSEWLVPRNRVERVDMEWRLDDGRPVVPLMESKFFHQYNHRHASNTLDGKIVMSTSEQLYDPAYEIIPRLFMMKSKIKRQETITARLVYRVITSVEGSARSTIAAIVPSWPCSNSCTRLINLGRNETLALLAIVNSKVFDYVVRCKLPGNNLNVWIWKQLPFPTAEVVRAPFHGCESFIEWVAPRAAELSYTSHLLSEFFADFDKPFPWNGRRRAQLLEEIDMAVAELYCIDEDMYRTIEQSFPDYQKDHCQSPDNATEAQ